jgi:hypothetical protein
LFNTTKLCTNTIDEFCSSISFDDGYFKGVENEPISDEYQENSMGHYNRQKILTITLTIEG